MQIGTSGPRGSGMKR